MSVDARDPNRRAAILVFSIRLHHAICPRSAKPGRDQHYLAPICIRLFVNLLKNCDYARFFAV